MQSVTVVERQENSDRAVLPELSFVHPIPGFTDLRRFVLVRLDEPPAGSAPVGEVLTGETRTGETLTGETAAGPILGAAGESPLYELRSLEQADVRFMVAVPGAYFSDYEIELDDQECGDLGLTDSADALVLVMLTVGRDAATTTANLLAPVVINARTRAAAQVILTGSDWPVRAPLG
jgi:flagellar assembly factor FliW